MVCIFIHPPGLIFATTSFARIIVPAPYACDSRVSFEIWVNNLSRSHESQYAHARVKISIFTPVSVSIRTGIRGRSGRPQCFNTSIRDSINKLFIFSLFLATRVLSITISANEDKRCICRAKCDYIYLASIKCQIK